MLEVAHVAKPHGLTGEVSVRLITNRTDRFEPASEFASPAGALVVETARPHRDRMLVRFRGVDTPEAARALAGMPLWAEPIVDDDELWVHDLIGATLVDRVGARRGRVEAVVANPQADLLELDTGALVPATFVTSVADGEVHVDEPDGLFDL